MANKTGEDVGGCVAFVIAAIAGLWWITAPSKDQVCRNRETPLFDRWHGIDGQPTCQHLIDQLDAQAAEARRRADDLERRLSEVESRLNM